MADILKTIEDQLPRGVVKSTIFEGANIVVYTADRSFFKNGDAAIKEVVNNIKKRIDLIAGLLWTCGVQRVSSLISFNKDPALPIARPGFFASIITELLCGSKII